MQNKSKLEQSFKNISIYKNEIILFIFSILLTYIKVIWNKSEKSQEICFSTAHSLAHTYTSALNSELLSLAENISLNTFSFSQIIIKSLSIFENGDCISLYFLRFIGYLFPLISLSILSLKVIRFRSLRLIFISIPTLFFLNYIYNLKYFLPLDFLDFNYSFLLGAINTTWHINGLLAQSFIFLLITSVFFIKNKFIRWLILIIGGLINPILNTLVPLGINLSKFLIQKKIYLSKIIECTLPFFSYITLKYIWNIFSNNTFISLDNDPNYKEKYLNFILNNDVHRNLYDNSFSQLLDPYIISFLKPIIKEIYSTRILSLITTYTSYLALIILFSLFLKFIKDKIRFINIFHTEPINKFFFSVINPLTIFLIFMIIIDFFVKLFLMELGNNPLNLTIIYNQYYFSRIINVLFRYIYFVCFFFSSVNIFNYVYFFIKKRLI